MENKSILKIGSICAIFLGISYLIVGIAYLMLPAAQKGGTLLHDTDKFLVSLASGSTLITIHHLAFGFGALLGIAVVIAVMELTRSWNSGLTHWISILAGFGFFVTTVDNFRITVVEPIRAALYLTGDAATQSAIKATQCFVSIDPQMWLGFGLVGIWVFVFSCLGSRRRAFSKTFGLVGIVTGLFYFFVEVGTALKNEILITVAAGLGALILGPVWYIWLGSIIRKRAVTNPS